MPRLIDSVARITGMRDRDALNVTIAEVLVDWLRPESVAIYKIVGEGDGRRVVLRARLVDGQAHIESDVARDPDSLPRLATMPYFRRCVKNVTQVRITPPAGSPVCTLFPIQNDSDVTGVLAVETRHALLPEQQRLVKGVLKIIRNLLAVLDYSEHDTLTGLMNRKTFDASFQKLLQAAPSASAPQQPPQLPPTGQPERRAEYGEFARFAAVIDIDHFKSINDRFGHLYGDEVLLLLARLMRGSFRATDQLYRFGGEEFVVVLDWVNPADAAMVFDRFRAKVEAFTFPQIGRVTISMGYTQIQPFDSPNHAIERADQALYYAKQNGRNQARSYELLISSGALSSKEDASDLELF
ncbi:GGDEF domain-containing protein [Piscinibacterium candidicorallinum]|uniref:diguanylate cyclase n=1 Tax=Piscinibacterium candidicorallinum TaxID=1793872 RepID=A0ABV7H1Z7_9BURK